MAGTSSPVTQGDVDLVVAAPRFFDGRSVRGGWELSHHAPVQDLLGVAVGSGRIAAVDTAAALVARFPGVAVETYRNATLAPGLIDAHVHLTLPGDGTDFESAASRSVEHRFRTAFVNLRAHLEAGVTTVRDVGSHLDFLEWQPSDILVVPRLIRYGPPITVTGGHMHQFGAEAATSEESRLKAKRNLEAGSDGIKLVASGGGTAGTVPHHASMEIDVLGAAVHAAHEREKLATTHALSLESMRRAVLAGSDGIEHLGFLTPEGRSEFDPGLAGLAITRGVTFGSTLGCNNRYTARAAAGALDPQELDEQAERTAYYVRNAARMRDRGGRVVAASDAGWKYTHFGDFANELRLLSLAGYSPIEVLRMATGASAEYLALADQIGYLAPGLSADLTVFDGDPTIDVIATEHVRAVYREGQRVYARFL